MLPPPALGTAAAAELELPEFALQFFGVHTKVKQRGNEHIASDAAKNVEVKGFHFISSADFAD